MIDKLFWQGVRWSLAWGIVVATLLLSSFTLGLAVATRGLLWLNH